MLCWTSPRLAVQRGRCGIGSTTATYRINRRPPKTIALEQSLQNGGGEQSLDWDYRKELPDLKVGDTVSFVAEVADKYPGEIDRKRLVPRLVVSRIPFPRRYLAAITKQMERLLTRVRTLYRQERSAHKLVLALNPGEDSYIPTCQLEAIRQEMLREQLLPPQMPYRLFDDLAANQAGDAVESDVLSSLQHSLRNMRKIMLLVPPIFCVNKSSRILQSGTSNFRRQSGCT